MSVLIISSEHRKNYANLLSDILLKRNYSVTIGNVSHINDTFDFLVFNDFGTLENFLSLYTPHDLWDIANFQKIKEKLNGYSHFLSLDNEFLVFDVKDFADFFYCYISRASDMLVSGKDLFQGVQSGGLTKACKN